MKAPKTTALLVLFLFAGRGNAQQCGTPDARLTYALDHSDSCPLSNGQPYTIAGSVKIRDYNFTCTADSNVSPPPNPGTVYWTGNPSSATGYGQTYCNYSSPYSSYDCPAFMYLKVTRASSPTDYNRFYNQAYSYKAVSGSCPQSNFVQDFQQCNGLTCQPPPPPPPPTCPKNYYCDPNTEAPCGDANADPCCCISPIILDVTGNGFQLTSAAKGVLFDIRGTGDPIQMAWIASGVDNAFLCLPDPDGKCDDGKDLFGNFTPQPQSANPNGFAALAVYDDPKNGGNGDGIIDSRDAIFFSLRLWIDSNHDGISQPEEIHTLPSLGVNAISLAYESSKRTDQYGNVFRYRAKVNPDDPGTSHVGRVAYDVFFVLLSRANANNLAARRAAPGDAPGCKVPALTKGGMLSPIGRF